MVPATATLTADLRHLLQRFIDGSSDPLDWDVFLSRRYGMIERLRQYVLDDSESVALAGMADLLTRIEVIYEGGPGRQRGQILAGLVNDYELRVTKFIVARAGHRFVDLPAQDELMRAAHAARLGRATSEAVAERLAPALRELIDLTRGLSRYTVEVVRELHESLSAYTYWLARLVGGELQSFEPMLDEGRRLDGLLARVSTPIWGGHHNTNADTEQMLEFQYVCVASQAAESEAPLESLWFQLACGL